MNDAPGKPWFLLKAPATIIWKAASISGFPIKLGMIPG